MKPTKRYLEYRRVLRLEPCNKTLEMSIRRAWERLPTQNERIVPRADGSSIMGFSMTDHGPEGVLVHCVRYIDQQGIGVIPMVEQSAKTIGEKKPLTDENFLDRDFFMLVSGEHIVSLNASTGAGMARTFLQGLIKKASLPSVQEKFDIVQVANIKDMRRISAAGGVKSIQLDWSLNELAADYALTKKGKETLFRKIEGRAKDLINNVIRSDGAGGFAKSEKGSVRLQINVPDGDVQPAKTAASFLGEAIAGDDSAEDFVLVLHNGDQIRRESVSVKKLVSLRRNANSFVASDVETEMLQFMKTLKDNGQTQV